MNKQTACLNRMAGRRTMNKILFINSGTNLLEIYTAIQHAKAQEGKEFDALYLLQASEDDEQTLKRLAKEIGAEIYPYTDDLSVVAGRSNYLQPVELDEEDVVQFDYTGNNKRVAVNAAARLKRAQLEKRFHYSHTYLLTEGQTVPTIQSNHRDVEFFLSEFNRWAFEYVMQVGAHQLIFFVKPEDQSPSGIELSLFELYKRMNRIGGYAARGVLLCDTNLNAQFGKDAANMRNNIDDLIEDVVELCETDIEKSAKTRTETTFDRFEWKSNVSSRTSRLMRPRVEVWGAEKHKDIDFDKFKTSLERYLEYLVR